MREGGELGSIMQVEIRFSAYRAGTCPRHSSGRWGSIIKQDYHPCFGSLILVGGGKDLIFSATWFLSMLFCFTGDEAVGMFAPRRRESSGQLYAPQYPALGFGQGKCSIIRDGGGRERMWHFLSLFSGNH